MKRLIPLLLMLALALPAHAGDYTYVSADKVKDWIQAGTPAHIVDIQVEDEFKAHHIQHSLATYAYPVKSGEDKARMDQAVAQAKETHDPVVIVCPRGKGGAKRGVDHMAAQGIDKNRLLILENGMAGWPYKELVESE